MFLSRSRPDRGRNRPRDVGPPGEQRL